MVKNHGVSISETGPGSDTTASKVTLKVLSVMPRALETVEPICEKSVVMARRVDATSAVDTNCAVVVVVVDGIGGSVAGASVSGVGDKRESHPH
jgi:hypothetical protein